MKKKKKQKNLTYFIVVLLGVLLLGTLVIAVLARQQRDSLRQEEQTGERDLTAESDPEEEQQKIINEVLGEPAVQEETPVAYEGKYGELLADPERMEAENIFAKETASADQVVLGFGGDICFHDEYANMVAYRQRGSDIRNCFSAEMLEEMHKVDIMMLNNEFTYTDRGEPLPGKAYTFRTKPENVSMLEGMGVDIVSIANNHTYDFGEISLFDTLDVLKNAGMPYVGAGRNLEEARKPVYFIAGDMKIAYVAATQIERLENPDTKGATENSAGVFRCLDVENLLETVKEAKANSDFVIVYLHWGTESTDELDWIQLDQAPKIVEAGADLIMGDHPHCLQGIDVIEGTPVMYSLGNFWFNSRTLDTCFVKVAIGKDGIISYQFLPAKQENCTTALFDGAEKARVLNYMRSISPNVTIDGDGFVSY